MQRKPLSAGLVLHFKPSWRLLLKSYIIIGAFNLVSLLTFLTANFHHVTSLATAMWFSVVDSKIVLLTEFSSIWVNIWWHTWPNFCLNFSVWRWAESDSSVCSYSLRILEKNFLGFSSSFLLFFYKLSVS